jgi:AcrR family transcriptional regulator
MPYVSQDERRRQLIEATVRLLQRDGADRVTTRAIATEAQAPLASIHYTFGSKVDVVRAAFDQVVNELLSELDLSIATGAGMASAITKVFARVGELLEDPRFAIVLGDLTPSDDPWMRSQSERVIEFCERLLRREAEAAGEPAPAMGFAQAARIAMAGVDGLIMQFEMHRDESLTRTDLAEMAELIGLALRSHR